MAFIEFVDYKWEDKGTAKTETKAKGKKAKAAADGTEKKAKSAQKVKKSLIAAKRKSRANMQKASRVASRA
jgi:hypothetical protein